jgi:uncharacterized membrane protein YeaQ/YmgE (transglycosylase-associated protein family)
VPTGTLLSRLRERSALCIGCGNRRRNRRDTQLPSTTEAFVLWALIIGLVVGALAKLIMPGRDPGGIIVTMLIGIAGSFIATFLGRALGWYRNGQGAGFIASLIGAILLLWIYRMVVARRSAP